MQRNEGMRQTMASDQQAPGRDGKGEASRLGVRSIKEASGLRDEELAVIFKEMRRASGITQEQIAGRLATGVNTIEALETGALSDLPEWQEIKRIVTTYAAQLGLDSRPILRRMQGQLGVADDETASPEPRQPAPEPQASEPQSPGTAAPSPKPRATPTGLPMPPSASAVPPAAQPATPDGARKPPGDAVPPKPGKPDPSVRPEQSRKPSEPKRSARPEAPSRSSATPAPETAKPEPPKTGAVRRFAKAAVNWSLLVVFVAALGAGIWYAAQNPRKAWNAIDGLPDPVPGLVRAAWEMVRPLENGNSGSRVSDPDKRRSDKLP